MGGAIPLDYSKKTNEWNFNCRTRKAEKQPDLYQAREEA